MKICRRANYRERLKRLSFVLACAALTLLGSGAQACVQRPAKTFNTPPAGSFDLVEKRFHLDAIDETVTGASVTRDFSDANRVPPLLGRRFIDSEYGSSDSHVMLLNHAFWTARLGATPTIIGRTVQLDGVSYTVVGIEPPVFDFPESARYWIPKRAN